MKFSHSAPLHMTANAHLQTSANIAIKLSIFEYSTIYIPSAASCIKIVLARSI